MFDKQAVRNYNGKVKEIIGTQKKGETMIQIFMTEDDAIHQKDEIQSGCWMALTDPTATEILEVSEAYGIDPDHLRAPLDEEERSRIEVEDKYTLILVDIPSIEERSGRVKEFYTYMKSRFILQILYRNASQYLQYLRVIDKKSDVVEQKLHKAQKNRELMELLELEKSLLYFSTSLRANEVVLEKLMKNEKVKKYPEDEELLEDVIIENKQAIEMANIYSGNLNVTTEAVASVISNNLNIVMKLLTTITLVMAIPTMVASFYGMNVRGIPFAEHPHGFWIVLGFTAVVSMVVTLIFSKKDLF